MQYRFSSAQLTLESAIGNVRDVVVSKIQDEKLQKTFKSSLADVFDAVVRQVQFEHDGQSAESAPIKLRQVVSLQSALIYANIWVSRANRIALI